MNQSRACQAVITCLILMIGQFVRAEEVRVVKADIVAATGSCLGPMTESEARAVLRENNITFPGASSAEVIALGKTVRQINSLNGDGFAPINGVEVEFNNKSGSSRQVSAKKIEICRNGHAHLGNTGLLAHELGHVIGNYKSGRFYSAYKSQIQPGCNVSRYSHTNYSSTTARNEEFAESFAAFVTNPSLLQNGGPSCQKALAFFKKEFPKGQQAGCEGKTILANSEPEAPAAKFEDQSEPDHVQVALSKVTSNPASYQASPWGAMIGQVMAMGLQMWAAQPQTQPQAVLPVQAPVPPPVAPAQPPLTPAGSKIPQGTR
jgi:hypothetical protein